MKNENKYCIVKGVAGLGNRIATLASAIEYAQITGRKVCVDWSDGMFGRKGENIFDFFFQVKGIEVAKIEDVENMLNLSVKPSNYKIGNRCSIYDNYEFVVKNRMFSKIFNYLSHYNYSLIIKGLHFFPSASIWKGKQGDYIKQGGALSYYLKEDVVVYIDYIPCFSESIVRNNICLGDSIEKKIKKWVIEKGVYKQSIGVHIRATDKGYNSDLELLFKNIEKIMKNNSINYIFLATDNRKIENIIKERYKDMVVVYPKILPEIKEGGGLHHWGEKNLSDELKRKMFEESLFDMFVLSRVEWLLYQGNSSFSTISKIIKNDNKCFDWTKLI